MAGVRDGDGGQRPAVVAIPARQFFGKVHGIAVGAAVAARNHFVVVSQGISHERGGSLDGGKVGRIIDKIG